EIQMLFNNTIKWIEAFVLMYTELVKGSEKAEHGSEKTVKGSEKAQEGSSKRAADNLEQENTKRYGQTYLIFVIFSHTKKVFANMKWEGKDFPGKVLDLEEAKTTQAKEIASLKKRVNKLEQKRKSRNSGLKRLRKVGSARKVKSSIEASL
nr:hypothetical protein [Tanacetum cinerariifolium]